MKRNVSRFRRFTAAVLSAMLIAVPISRTGAQEYTDGERKSAVVEEIIEYLSVYSRYDEVTQARMYKEGLLKAIENNPELYESVMRTILEMIDENSEYYTPEEAEALKQDVSGTICGIGITFEICADGVSVVSVIPGTPAADAGLVVGDVIVSADGTALAGMNSEAAASHIRGEEGTPLTIGIKREGVDNIIYADLVRAPITGTSVTSRVYKDEGADVMYIRVHGFVSNTAESFKAVLDSASEQGISKIIIDLRDNGGGLFDRAIQMADYLLPKDSVITTEDHKIDLLDVVYKAQSDAQSFDTAVLINGNTASASEVLTAALSENDRAYIIGTKSYGKGTIQTIADLPYGDCMKYTMGYYLTPDGNNVHKEGITPDEYVENTYTPFEIEKYAKFSYMNVYDLGSSGDEIKTAKELLKVWGSYRGEIDDQYDADMFDAVYKFQMSTGLYPYGVLDLTTQRELYTRMEKSKVLHDNQLDAALDYLRNHEADK